MTRRPTSGYGFDSGGVTALAGASIFFISTHTSAPVARTSKNVTTTMPMVQTATSLVARSARSEKDRISPDRYDQRCGKCLRGFPEVLGEHCQMSREDIRLEHGERASLSSVVRSEDGALLRAAHRVSSTGGEFQKLYLLVDQFLCLLQWRLFVRHVADCSRGSRVKTVLAADQFCGALRGFYGPAPTNSCTASSSNLLGMYCHIRGRDLEQQPDRTSDVVLE